jgi:hypothetical protein
MSPLSSSVQLFFVAFGSAVVLWNAVDCYRKGKDFRGSIFAVLSFTLLSIALDGVLFEALS